MQTAARQTHGGLAQPAQVAPSTANRSAGHAALRPLQTSGTSHIPMEALQVKPAALNRCTLHSFVVPVQTSATSQGPCDARHTVPAAAFLSSGHDDDPPVHLSSTSQGPANHLHTSPAGRYLFEGHDVDLPVHFSSTSQTPFAFLHTLPSLAYLSLGQSCDLPSHLSGSSQGPLALRHTVFFPKPLHSPRAEHVGMYVKQHVSTTACTTAMRQSEHLTLLRSIAIKPLFISVFIDPEVRCCFRCCALQPCSGPYTTSPVCGNLDYNPKRQSHTICAAYVLEW